MRFSSSRFLRLVIVGCALIFTTSSIAADFDCKVTKKIDYDSEYSADHIARAQFGNRIEEVGENAWISRCSYSQIAGKVTCDRYKIDRVVIDPIVKVKKFYIFSAQYDLQLYPDLTYIENNGRGSIAFGKCAPAKG